MKVVLVNPPLSLQARYGDLGPAGSRAPPFGLCNLAAVVREAGLDPEILDAAALDLSAGETAKRIAGTGAAVVGLTATTLSIHSAARVARAVKELRPGITAIIGGPHVTALPEDTLDRFPGFDLGILGEAEETILPVLEAVVRKENPAGIDGVVFRRGPEPVRTEPRKALRDMDRLPFPAWDLLPALTAYYRPAPFNCRRFPAASLVTSRGCTSKCIFCSRAVFGNSWRGYSAGYVVDMIRKLHRDYGVREIKFFDDNFVLSRTRVLQFCDLIKRDYPDLSWSCSARIDRVDPEMLTAMKRAGCWQIFYGIESGSDEILDSLNKQIRTAEIEKTVKLTKNAGIGAVGSFMIGNPGETRKTIRETMRFARKLGLADFQMTFFTPLPGSEIYPTAAREGEFEDDWEKMNLWHPAFVPHGLTRQELQSCHKRAFRGFYLRPRVMLSYAARIRSREHLKALWEGFTAFTRMQR